MADAVNAPENKPQAGETSIHGGSSLGETAPGQVSLPDPMSPANPKSPTETQGDKAEDAGDLGVSEPPEKKARKYMEEEMGHRMKRVREGFDLTSSALDKVQQHLDISRQNSKDLTQLTQEVHYDKVGAKYTLAQMQSMLSCFQNVEWQLSGSKADANTSLKAVANKTLAQATLATQNLKSIHTEIKDGNEKLLQAVADGFGTLAAAFTATALPSKESVGSGCPPAPPAAPLAAFDSGTTHDSYVWNAWLLLGVSNAKCTSDSSYATWTKPDKCTSYSSYATWTKYAKWATCGYGYTQWIYGISAHGRTANTATCLDG